MQTHTHNLNTTFQVCAHVYVRTSLICMCGGVSLVPIWARLGLIRESNEIRGVREGDDALMDVRRGTASQ